MSKYSVGDFLLFKRTYGFNSPSIFKVLEVFPDIYIMRPIFVNSNLNYPDPFPEDATVVELHGKKIKESNINMLKSLYG